LCPPAFVPFPVASPPSLVIPDTSPSCCFKLHRRVKRKALAEDAASSSSSSCGLDAALSAIAGPAKMNTVTKSSADWEVNQQK